MRTVGVVLAAALLTGCRPAAKHPVGTSGVRVEKRDVITQNGRKTGELTIKTSARGTETDMQYVDNGRGPVVHQAMTLGADWAPVTYTASGKHTFGAAISEKFTRDGANATWSSPDLSGSQRVTGSAFYVPGADGPISPFLVPAALKAGGTIDLLPAGKATVTKVGEASVTVNGQTRLLHCYAITGLDLQPDYAWFDSQGFWFGDVSPWASFVPPGWESAIEPLITKQRDFERERQAKLAALGKKSATGFAFTNARVLDVERGEWLQNQTVLVKGDSIVAVGKTGSVRVPAGVETVSAEGMSILPGLIDMHAHVGAADALLDLASGVTTVRDVGNDPDELDDLVKRFDNGTAIGPHVVRMGFIEGRGDKAASAKITATTTDEAKTAVAAYVKRGYDGIKIYNSVPPEIVPTIVAEAHARNLLVTGHIPKGMLARDAVAAGFDGIEHINQLLLNFFANKDTDTRDLTRFTLVADRAADFNLGGDDVKAFFGLLAQKKTVLCPTLGAFEDLFQGVPGTITPGLEQVAQRLPINLQRSEFLQGGLQTDAAGLAVHQRSWLKLLETTKALADAKVPVVAGTDSDLGGVMLQHEIALFVKAGFSTKEALRMATINSARAMRQDKKIGSVASGKRADLVVIAGDPLANIDDLRKTVYTLRGGVLYRADALFTAAGVAP